MKVECEWNLFTKLLGDNRTSDKTHQCMPKSAINLARQLLTNNENGLEDLRIHQFEDDKAAHNDSAIEKLYVEFSSELDRAQSELSSSYGEPYRTGAEDDEVIPLGGVFKFAVWEIEGRILFVVAAHEDRECPILLILGTASK